MMVLSSRKSRTRMQGDSLGCSSIASILTHTYIYIYVYIYGTGHIPTYMHTCMHMYVVIQLRRPRNHQKTTETLLRTCSAFRLTSGSLQYHHHLITFPLENFAEPSKKFLPWPPSQCRFQNWAGRWSLRKEPSARVQVPAHMVHTYIYICTVHIHTYTYICVCVHVYMHIYMYICVCIFICIHMYICVYVCIYVHTYVYENIGTKRAYSRGELTQTNKTK